MDLKGDVDVFKCLNVSKVKKNNAVQKKMKEFKERARISAV